MSSFRTHIGPAATASVPGNPLRTWMAFAAMMLFGCILALAPHGLHAQEEDEERETRRTQAMSESVYRELAEAQELTDGENYGEAMRILDKLVQSEKLTPYEKAQIYNFRGFIHYAQENYKNSIQAYQTVLAQPEIPEGLRLQTIYTLAQLHFTTENWGRAIELIREWLKDAENPGPEPYVLLSSAYYSQEQYAQMIEPLNTAMQIARERDVPVKEQWWLLLRVAHYELGNFEQVKEILEVLVVNWPKKEYWTQLSAIYGELGAESRQLSAYASAYDQNLLERSAELVQLAQLYLQAEVPYKAAQILEKGLENDRIEKTAQNYRLLSQAWMLAAEDEEAIPALRTAARMTADGDLDARLAQSYLNLSRYDECIDAAREALRKGGLRREDNAQIVLGMCLFEQDRYEESKQAFRAAADDDRSRKTARQWISFIEREQERLEQLERSLQQARR